jgi:hypothetical protein
MDPIKLININTIVIIGTVLLNVLSINLPTKVKMTINATIWIPTLEYLM